MWHFNFIVVACIVGLAAFLIGDATTPALSAERQPPQSAEVPLTPAGREVKARYPDLSNAECNRVGRMCLSGLPRPERRSQSGPAPSGGGIIATIAPNSFGCFSKNSLQDVVKFRVAGDRDSIGAYFARYLCIPLFEEVVGPGPGYRLLSANEFACRFFGLAPGELFRKRPGFDYWRKEEKRILQALTRPPYRLVLEELETSKGRVFMCVEAVFDNGMLVEYHLTGWPRRRKEDGSRV